MIGMDASKPFFSQVTTWDLKGTNVNADGLSFFICYIFRSTFTLWWNIEAENLSIASLSRHESWGFTLTVLVTYCKFLKASANKMCGRVNMITMRKTPAQSLKAYRWNDNLSTQLSDQFQQQLISAANTRLLRIVYWRNVCFVQQYRSLSIVNLLKWVGSYSTFQVVPVFTVLPFAHKQSRIWLPTERLLWLGCWGDFSAAFPTHLNSDVFVQLSADWTVSPAQCQWHYADDWSPILHTTGCIADEEWCHWGGPGQGTQSSNTFPFRDSFQKLKGWDWKHAWEYSFQSCSHQADILGLGPERGHWFGELRGKLCTHRMLYGLL